MVDSVRQERRLAAILAADVVGYSRLMGADEVGTLNSLKAHRRELIDPTIANHAGRVVKTTGDGMLVEFGSAVDAVQCAVAVQKAMAERNLTVPEASRIIFRIGINVGDTIIDGDDIFGDGVNIAARLEAISEPGQLCISGNTFEQVRNKTEAAIEDIGEQALKNIAQPIRVYRLKLNMASNPAVATDRPSIAVLPFNNMSSETEQEHFADGMTEDIITELSRMKGLLVIARNSTFTYKGQSVDIKRVAAELGVKYVLEGSVRKAGSRIRITAQLIEAKKGGHVWAERYDRDLLDIFELQDEIVRSVVSTLQTEMIV